MTETLSHIALRRLSGAEAAAAYTALPGVRIATDSDGRLLIDAPSVCPERLTTNDIAEILPDGSFKILGRTDNIICSGGLKFQLEALEGIDETVFRDRYIIRLTDIALMAQTKTALLGVEGVAKVNAHLDYAKSFVTIRNIVSIVSLVLIVMLVFVSVFIMTNTIKLATFSP